MSYEIRAPADAMPPSWEHVKLGEVFEQVTDTGHEEDLTVLAVSVTGQVLRRDELERRLTGEVDRDKYLRVQPGDLAYNTMRMWQGACGLVRENGYVSPAYTVCRPKEGEHPPFWAQAFKSERYIGLFERFSQGLTGDRLRLYFHLFREIPALRPSSREQRLIAQILDTVDQAIRKTEQLIAKLKLVKQGLLQDLLTRGIDENGELRDPERHPEQFKDSPLGRIPREWEVSTVSREFEVASGFTLGPDRSPRGHPWPYLRVANVFRDHLDLGDVALLEARNSELRGRQLLEGDLLVVEGHANPGEIGRCGMATGAVRGLTFQNHLFRLRPFRLESQFAHNWLNSNWVRAYWRREAASSSGLYTINQTKLSRLLVLVPPEAERFRIRSSIEPLITLVSQEETYLPKLRLLKSGLMEDLLTGRVRVTPLLDSAP